MTVLVLVFLLLCALGKMFDTFQKPYGGFALLVTVGLYVLIWQVRKRRRIRQLDRQLKQDEAVADEIRKGL